MGNIRSLVNQETGIQHAEEALLLALIAVALTGLVTSLKTSIGGVFSSAGTKMSTTP